MRPSVCLAWWARLSVEMLYMGLRLTAAQAEQWGLINRAVPAEELRAGRLPRWPTPSQLNLHVPFDTRRNYSDRVWTSPLRWAHNSNSIRY